MVTLCCGWALSLVCVVAPRRWYLLEGAVPVLLCCGSSWQGLEALERAMGCLEVGLFQVLLAACHKVQFPTRWCCGLGDCTE